MNSVCAGQSRFQSRRSVTIRGHNEAPNRGSWQNATGASTPIDHYIERGVTSW